MRNRTETDRICDLLGSAVKAQPGYMTHSQPATALHCAADMVRMAEDLLVDAVKRARSEGQSWAEVGAALGVSKQAAQQRFARYCV